MSKPTTTRRGFLGAVAAAVGLVAAGPAVAAAETVAPLPPSTTPGPFMIDSLGAYPLSEQQWQVLASQSDLLARAEKMLSEGWMTRAEFMEMHGWHRVQPDGVTKPAPGPVEVSYTNGFEDGYTEGHAEGLKAGKAAAEESVKNASAEAYNRAYLVGRSGAEERVLVDGSLEYCEVRGRWYLLPSDVVAELLSLPDSAV